MTPEEKARLRTAFDTVTAGFDKAAMKVLEKQAGSDMAAALVEYEALAVLSDTHQFALILRGNDRAFLTFPKQKDGPHLLSQAVIRL